MSKEFFSLKLSEIADVVAGQSPESIYYSNIEGVPFLQGNRTFGTLYPSIDTYTSKVTKLAKKDEVLMSVRAPVGDLNFAPCDLCIGRGLASIKAKDGNNKFIYYALKYNINNLLRQGSGTTFDSVNKDVINDFELILPKDKADRDKVTNILSALDSKIELNNRINAELEAMAKTLYDYWFVQFDFPDEKGKPYKTSGGKMVWNEELKREIPEGWEVKNLTEEMDLQYGFPFSTELFNDNGIGIPVIRIRDILNCSISNYSTEEVDDKYRINKGDILVGMDGNFHINYWNRDNCYLNQRSLRIRSSNKSISEIQARYSIEPFIQAREKNVSRTTVAHLSAKDINDLKILKADNEFQNKANTYFNSNLEKIVSNRIQNQKLTELRDWLLPMLMNGQVKVN